MTVNLYPSDVRKLSNEELKTLAAELREAYCCDDCGCWQDEAAELRHDQLMNESLRRQLVGPALQPLGPREVTDAALRALAVRPKMHCNVRF